MDLGLTGKIAIVAGASRGIGLAIAERFAGEGARVVVTGRSAAPLEAGRAKIAGAAGAENVLAVAGDLTRESEIARLFETVEKAWGPADAVVANIGSGSGQGGFAIGREEWDRVLNENLLGSTLLAKVALERLTARKSGSLTFIGSIAGTEAIGAPVPYSAAKAGLHMAAKLYARQAGEFGVRVNVVAPGNVLFPGGSWEQKLAERRAHFEDYVRREVALQRFAAPDEIADIVVFLASARAAFVTGAVWTVDGGQTHA